MRIEAVAAEFSDVGPIELRMWIERGWIIPDDQDGEWEFAEIDLARVRLVRSLRRELEVPVETMPLVLSLIDQLYDTRAAMRRMLDAIGQQAPEVRAVLLKALSEAD